MSERGTYIRKWIRGKMQNQLYCAAAMGAGSFLLLLVIFLASGGRTQKNAEPVVVEEDTILGWITPSNAARRIVVMEMEESEETDETSDGETASGTEETKKQAAKPAVQPSQTSGIKRSYGRFLLNTGAADIIWSYLKAKGWTDTAIAGVLGNFHQESGLDPGKVESNGVGYGLGQWSYDRRTGLETYASKRNLPVNNIFMQLDYLMVEPGESSFVQSYMKTDFSSVEAAVRSWNSRWERPNRQKAHLEDVRIPYAIAYYYYYTGQSGPVTYYRVESGGTNAPAAVDNSNKTGLVSDGNGWRYCYTNGKYASGVWKVIDGQRCYFGLDGYLVPELTETISATAADAFNNAAPGNRSE